MNKPMNVFNERVINNAIEEIKSRPELSSDAKARGIRSLLRAKSRLLHSVGGPQKGVAETAD